MERIILKVDDEFQEIGTRTVDDRNRLTIGDFMKGSKRVRLYMNERESSSCSLLLKFPLQNYGFIETKKPLKALQGG